MQRKVAPRQLAPGTSSGVITPLIIINQCPGDLWPAIGTQSGIGPETNGFKLGPGERKELKVSENWQGRVWGRANCSFNDAGRPANPGPKACGSGDCNGELNCKVGGDTPVTLGEWTLNAGDGQTYYDISLVDGYNLPMAIILEAHGIHKLEDIPPNLTNPSCVGTVGLLAPQDFNPYPDVSSVFLGTNSSFKLPLDVKVDNEQVNNWCPWDLMVNKPQPPPDGVYTYPDANVERPAFNPCLSACAKYNKPEDCCQGQWNSPSTCVPGEFSKNAKAVCPDAYSYAFDDQTSTFIIPAGAGFVVLFCPGGRSTNILTAEAPIVQEAGHGEVSYGGGGNGNNSDNRASRDCSNLPVAARENMRGWQQTGLLKRGPEGDLEGFHVLQMMERGVHRRDLVEERRRQLLSRSKSVATNVSPSELGGMTWYLMGAGLFLTATFFVML